QPAPSSAVTTSRPSDSRKPARLTPTACTTQTLTVRPPSRHFTTSASNVRYGYGPLSSGRVRKSSTIWSRLFANRETWLLLIRSTPELLHELLHPPRRHAGEIRVGDHRHERLLGPPPRLQQ